MTRRWTRGALLIGAAAVTCAGLAATASATTATRGGSAAKVIKVGFVYSRTGLLSQFGAEMISGYKLGLQYTKGKCGGYTINTTYVDDATDSAKAVAAAKDLIGQGYKIIAGTASSGAALQIAPIADQNQILYISGAAASDAVTGINRHTFRAGRQSYQDVLDAANILPPKTAGKKVVVFAEDTAFGQGNVAAVTAVFGGKGHTVSKLLVPFGAADLTPYAQQLKNLNADMVFVAWAGTNGPAMWQALQQQGVSKSTTIVTGLANRAIYPVFGPQVPGVTLVSHYVYQAPKNPVNEWLVSTMKKNGQVPDIFTPDGFVTAQMICQAVTKAAGDSNVDGMISALEGWQFTGPKGVQRIRPQDHAMLQPMFQVQLVKGGNGKYDAKVLKAVSPGLVQPPVKSFPTP
jgi:branched-chain amino acid transport system substrate-binding protein